MHTYKAISLSDLASRTPAQIAELVNELKAQDAAPTYRVVDSHTGKVLSTGHTARQARAKADRLDLQYGSYRYSVQVAA